MVSGQDASWMSLLGGVLGMSNWKEAPRGRPRTDSGEIISWERLGIPPEELEDLSARERGLGLLLRLLT